jgi:hypothetical protein
MSDGDICVPDAEEMMDERVDLKDCASALPCSLSSAAGSIFFSGLCFLNANKTPNMHLAA